MTSHARKAAIVPIPNGRNPLTRKTVNVLGGLARPGLGRRRPNPAQAVDPRQSVTRGYTKPSFTPSCNSSNHCARGGKR
jgi:hypothetical protein